MIEYIVKEKITLLAGILSMTLGTLVLAMQIIFVQLFSIYYFSWMTVAPTVNGNIYRFREIIFQSALVYSFLLSLLVIVFGIILIYYHCKSAINTEASTDEHQQSEQTKNKL